MSDQSCIWVDIRRDKLDSQFIVTKFSILHAGRRLLFIFHIGGTSYTIARPSPPIRAIKIEERDRVQNTVYVQYYNMKSEIF